MRIRSWAAALAFTLLLSTSSGCVYANVTSPLDIDMNETQLGDKTGESSSYSVLWLVAWGDSGSKAAAENGGLKTIKHADRRVFSILWGLYSRVTTVAYGE